MCGQLGLFLSTFINKIDKKGRVSVPATFRAALSQEDFQGIVVFRSYAQEALEGVGMSSMDVMADRMDDNFAFFSDDHDEMATVLFGESVQLAFDGDGRITLPQELMESIGLDGQVAFVGLGRKFQMWDPKMLDARKVDARRRVQDKKMTLPKGNV